jgi:hypothetical protein
MSYDPKDYTVGWRDVCAGFCLAGIALATLAISSELRSDTASASPLSERSMMAGDIDICDTREIYD